MTLNELIKMAHSEAIMLSSASIPLALNGNIDDANNMNITIQYDRSKGGYYANITFD